MALSIYNNIYSLNAQKSLNTASNLQGKSLERLSSGLRINHAADDASGLAISEKLRSQMSGMKRASMNAQDGISYLQTAEGGMEEVTNILQRMREIAVQAGNGIYTTNDRAMLQLEVDQLKDEVNRISRTTEFNTKKLLNGDGTALWSSDKDFIGAIVRGPVAQEGNYRIETNVNPGSNNVYKTNTMSVNTGVLVGEVTNLDATTTNMLSVRDPENIPTTGVTDMLVRVSSGTTLKDAAFNHAATLSSIKSYKQDGSNWMVSSAAVTTTSASASGYFELEFTDEGSLTSDRTFKYRLLDAKTGEVTNWMNGTITGVAPTATAHITLSLTALGTAATSIVLALPGSGAINNGDKMVGTFSPTYAAGTDWAASGGGTVKVGNGPWIDYQKIGELTKGDNGDNKVDYNEVTVNIATLDSKTGVVDWGNLTLEFRENTGAAVTPGMGQTLVGVADVRIRDDGSATKDTKLSDIKGFTNDDGRNILENTQELTIYAKGKSASIYLEADDTIEDFKTKLTQALVEKLGLGADDTTVAGQIANNNLVNYVPAMHTIENTNEAMPGTFVINTAAIGSDSELVFIGDQGLIDALGIATVKKGENSTMDVKVTDAHTGKFIGSDNLSDGRLRNVIAGVDVTLAQNSGVDVSYDTASRTMKFTPNAEQAAGYLHVVDNRTELQIGANQGQTMNISVGQLDTTGLEIDDVYVMDMDLSQKAITKLDKAIQSLNAGRATIGAQINRLEYTISNLETARQNLTSAESRIRDLDMAEETANLSKNQVLVQAATAMVAQANQVPQQALTLLQGLR